jgi:hypothetical protein
MHQEDLPPASQHSDRAAETVTPKDARPAAAEGSGARSGDAQADARIVIVRAPPVRPPLPERPDAGDGVRPAQPRRPRSGAERREGARDRRGRRDRRRRRGRDPRPPALRVERRIGPGERRSGRGTRRLGHDRRATRPRGGRPGREHRAVGVVAALLAQALIWAAAVIALLAQRA